MSQRIAAVVMLLRNWTRSLLLSRFQTSRRGDCVFRAYRPSDLSEIDRICRAVGRGPLPRYDRLLLKLCGPRTCLVATKGDEAIGFEHFYFNDRDLAENTIHEGYIAVATAHAGGGIASTMRRVSLNHFREGGLAGVSTRISHKNQASMMSAVKCGFTSVEEYQDPRTHEARSYLIASLNV